MFVGDSADITHTSTEESINRFIALITKCCGLAHRIFVEKTVMKNIVMNFERVMIRILRIGVVA
jgi:hypothetical protein